MEPAEADENIITRFGWYINFERGIYHEQERRSFGKICRIVDEALSKVMHENMEYRPNGIKRTNQRRKKFDFEAALKAL